MRTALTLLTSILLLSACDSFNHTLIITNTTAPAETSHTASLPVIPVAASSPVLPSAITLTPVLGVDNLRCPFYSPPHLDDMPELPYHALEEARHQANPNDAVKDVIKQHILDLRMYIRTVHYRPEEAYNQYLINCQTTSSGVSPVIPTLPVPPVPASDAAAAKALNLPGP